MHFGCHDELYLLLGLLVHVCVVLTVEISVAVLVGGVLVVVLTGGGPRVVFTEEVLS